MVTTTLKVYGAILLTFIFFTSNVYANNNQESSSKTVMSVKVKSTLLRTKPSFIGKKVLSLKYGDKVSVLEKKDPWIKAKEKVSAKNGWVHLSALSEKNIVLKSSDLKAETGADQGEIILAGKGFSKSVEQDYKKKNKDLAKPYENVDRLEKKELSYENLYNFANQGKLNKQF